MTIVELFDEKPINNVVGALAFEPDKVIFVGGHSKKTFIARKLPVLRNYLDKKGYNDIAIEYVNIRRNSLKDIVEKFEKIYKENEDCKFHVEVTGGEDLVLIGLGVLYQRYPDIELYQISGTLKNVCAISLDKLEGEKLDIECHNTVEENLLLHGASVVSANGSDILPSGYSWDWEFMIDLEAMWSICCKGGSRNADDSAPTKWNKVTSMFACLDSANLNSSAEMSKGKERYVVQVTKAFFDDVFLKQHDQALFDKYVELFVRSGLLKFKEDKEFVYIDYKNDQVRMCISTAGLVLEMKIYQICFGLVNKREGDCLTSVMIDWDGDDDLVSRGKFLYNANDPDSTIDTTNEIDVLVNCGLVPYFISCKNGRFNSEEMYKLYTVGERFGTGYSKKIIVAASLTQSLGDAKNVMLQRAKDMDIIIIEDVHKKTDQEIAEELRIVMDLPKVRSYA